MHDEETEDHSTHPAPPAGPGPSAPAAEARGSSALVCGRAAVCRVFYIPRSPIASSQWLKKEISSEDERGLEGPGHRSRPGAQRTDRVNWDWPSGSGCWVSRKWWPKTAECHQPSGSLVGTYPVAVSRK